MILNTRNKPVHGDHKIIKRFAWLPKWINDKKIWLQSYQLVYEYKVKERRHLPIIGPYVLPLVTGIWGEWELISSKII
jgi:hypothetical protein